MFRAFFSGASLLIAVVLVPACANAEIVIPRTTVTSHVNIRSAPDGEAMRVGQLEPGQSLPFVRSVPRWHEVRVSATSTGFVSKSFTDVLPDPVSPVGTTAAIHFLDVGTGDSAIIDMGQREIIIDGGESIAVLNQYAERTGILDGEIELVIVTHGDFDHWNGLSRLLGFDGVVDTPRTASEYWDPGYNRDCNPPDQGGRVGYLAFVQSMRAQVPAARFKRPLGDHHPAAVDSGAPAPSQLSSLPGVTFTVLHTDATPTQGDCSYLINNASIVVMVEISGVRFLFTGDANGKERDETSPGTPGHVEQRLLALEASRPGTLRADVLKAPHHGSETASTQAFVNAVNPEFAIVSASVRHHLPRETVIGRYSNGQRVILRTDEHRENDMDHILCIVTPVPSGPAGTVECNFADVLNQ